MNYELLEQSVQFTFSNEKYGENGKKKIYKNVKKDTQAESLKKVGEAISSLQKDSLDAIVLIQKHGVALV